MDDGKIIYEQTTTVTFFVLLYIGILNLVYHLMGQEMQAMDMWYAPFEIILLSLLCSCVTTAVLYREVLFGNHYWIRVVFHCILLYVIVIVCGYFFRWYADFKEYVIVSIGYFLIFALGWIVALARAKYDEMLIDRALEKMRDEE